MRIAALAQLGAIASGKPRMRTTCLGAHRGVRLRERDLLAVEKVIDVHQGHSLSIRRKLPASCHKMPGMKRVMRPCSTGCLGRRLISENARPAAHCPTRPDYALLSNDARSACLDRPLSPARASRTDRKSVL